jgi:hypothetical protein
MAEIKLNQFGCADKPQYNFAKGTGTVPWKCDVAITVNFLPPDNNCFGEPFHSFPAGHTNLRVVNKDVDSRFETPCTTLDTYDIIFTGTPHPPKKKYPKKAKKAAKKAVVKKAAKKAPAKKAAKKVAKKAVKKVAKKAQAKKTAKRKR